MFLTEEQESIKQLAREFAEREIVPRSKQLESGDIDTLKEVWAKCNETGLTGVAFPEAYGGIGGDALSFVLILEELAKVSAGFATSFSVHCGLGGNPLLQHGTDEQKNKYLPDIASGESVVAFALTEPNAGSDAGSGLTTAVKDGDDYVINGTKIFITNAKTAKLFLVTARTNPEEKGPKGLTAFFVHRDNPGMKIEDGDTKMGLYGSDWGELVFDNCRVSADDRLSDEGMGFKLFMKSLDAGRVSISAISLGLAESALEAAKKYATEREQFGKSISEFQAIQFKLADMAMEIEAARGLVYNAARLRAVGANFSKEASMAKLYASEMVNRVCNEAVQIFGGYGYTKDFPVERYFRDARVMSLFEGTSEVQHIVIGRAVLQDA